MLDENDVFGEDDDFGGAEKDNIKTDSVRHGSAFIKCERCGGNMLFDPQTQSLKCERCGFIESFEKDARVNEQDIEKGFAAAERWDGEATVFRCESCGAQVVLKKGEVAAACPFCSTPHVVESDELPGIKPQAVYPFALTKQNALEKAKKWARSMLFAPSKFKKNLQRGQISGVYQPCFTFDSDTVSQYYGRIGKRRTRTVKTKNGVRTESYIAWRNVSGSYNELFDDIFVSCGKMPQNELEKLLPYRIETLCAYEPKLLSGYSASHYSRDLTACWRDAKTVMDKQIRDAILRRYSCDVVDYLNVSTVHNAVTYKYVLLPVYYSNFVYRKKQYPVTVNGNTGKVSGKTPVSPWRVLTAVIIALALFFGLFLLTDCSSCAENSDYDYYAHHAAGGQNACACVYYEPEIFRD